MTHYQTYSDYLRHPLYLIVRQVVIRRANGLCEICHAARVSEVHHYIKDKSGKFQYPFWDRVAGLCAFDTPSNLKAVCHACHCREHGKET